MLTSPSLAAAVSAKLGSSHIHKWPTLLAAQPLASACETLLLLLPLLLAVLPCTQTRSVPLQLSKLQVLMMLAA